MSAQPEPLISVIMWDANFRERFNAFTSLADQTLPPDRYEIIYVDYFARIPAVVAAENRIRKQAVCLRGLFPWHAGKCVNAGIARARGELIVVIDADVIVGQDFLSEVAAAFVSALNRMAHVRRWDEPHYHRGHLDWEHLSELCILANPENYGGCLIARRESLLRVNGCDEQPIFQRDSAVFMELHVRLLNLGLEHVWLDPLKLLHPWHPGTRALAERNRLRAQMQLIESRRAGMVSRANPKRDAVAVRGREPASAALHALWVYGASRADAHWQARIRPRLLLIKQLLLKRLRAQS